VVPLKVMMLFWRFLANWIPTRDNLFKMGIRNTDALNCIFGCGSVQIVSHLFLTCVYSHKVWLFLTS
jgi:hypothetical protein